LEGDYNVTICTAYLQQYLPISPDY